MNRHLEAMAAFVFGSARNPSLGVQRGPATRSRSEDVRTLKKRLIITLKWCVPRSDRSDTMQLPMRRNERSRLIATFFFYKPFTIPATVFEPTEAH